jgi:hypothetical protein
MWQIAAAVEDRTRRVAELENALRDAKVQENEGSGGGFKGAVENVGFGSLSSGWSGTRPLRCARSSLGHNMPAVISVRVTVACALRPIQRSQQPLHVAKVFTGLTFDCRLNQAADELNEKCKRAGEGVQLGSCIVYAQAALKEAERVYSVKQEAEDKQVWDWREVILGRVGLHPSSLSPSLSCSLCSFSHTFSHPSPFLASTALPRAAAGSPADARPRLPGRKTEMMGGPAQEAFREGVSEKTVFE